jgi:hypothetical protein
MDFLIQQVQAESLLSADKRTLEMMRHTLGTPPIP